MQSTALPGMLVRRSAHRIFSGSEPVRSRLLPLPLWGTTQPEVAADLFGGTKEDGFNARFQLIAVLLPTEPLGRPGRRREDRG